eukprot:563281-Amphidinium_carterae.1
MEDSMCYDQDTNLESKLKMQSSVGDVGVCRDFFELQFRALYWNGPVANGLFCPSIIGKIQIQQTRQAKQTSTCASQEFKPVV